MRVSRTRSLVNNVQRMLNTFTTNYVKRTIGDSTFNHRTPTVSQVIRFLSRRNATKQQRALAKQLRTVYNTPIVKRYLKAGRESIFSNRTDAFDINELLLVVQFNNVSPTVGRRLAA